MRDDTKEWTGKDLEIQVGLVLCQGYVPAKVAQIKIVENEHKIPI